MPQLGYPDLVASAWIARYAPAQTPGTVIERLRAQTQALTASADFAGMRPEEFAAFTQ